MLIRSMLVVICLASSRFVAIAQTEVSKPSHVRNISLLRVGRHAEAYTKDTLKVTRIVLEDFRTVEDAWVHVFQLYDPKSKVRRGETADGLPFEAHSFLICTDEEIGKPLLERKDRWLNRSVNVYLRIYDLGLTTHMYVGYVTKVELLDEKGQVIETISAKG